MRSEMSIFVKISLAVLSVVVVVTVLSLSLKYNELTKKRDKLKADVEQAQLELEKLRDEVNAEYNEEYIIKIAREELGYRMPDEVIYYNNLNK
ncbi:MAG: septum formation initiator family protein [Clostridia bacterium]|nr:septum formation initiator family protein [Clostridia bacterium]